MSQQDSSCSLHISRPYAGVSPHTLICNNGDGVRQTTPGVHQPAGLYLPTLQMTSRPSGEISAATITSIVNRSIFSIIIVLQGFVPRTDEPLREL